MHLITVNTEKALLSHLDDIKYSAPHLRCAYIHVGTSPEEAEAQLPRLQEILADELIDATVQCYVCEDYDVFIVHAGLSNRILQKMTDRLQREKVISTVNHSVTLFEVGFDWMKIKTVLDRKITAQEEKRRLAYRQMQEKKRLEIMNMVIDPAEIKSVPLRRAAHVHAQIMVVEDDVFTHKLINKTIGEQAETHFCIDAQTAISKYTTISPDIVFVDIGLPDISGHDVVAKLLQIDPQAFIVMLSGNGDVTNIKQSLALGAKGFVVKPFTKAKLWEYIARSPHLNTPQK